MHLSNQLSPLSANLSCSSPARPLADLDGDKCVAICASTTRLSTTSRVPASFAALAVFPPATSIASTAFGSFPGPREDSASRANAPTASAPPASSHSPETQAAAPYSRDASIFALHSPGVLSSPARPLAASRRRSCSFLRGDERIAQWRDSNASGPHN